MWLIFAESNFFANLADGFGRNVEERGDVQKQAKKKVAERDGQRAKKRGKRLGNAHNDII